MSDMDEEKNLEKINKQKDFKKNLSISTLLSIPFLAINFYDALFLIVYLFIAITLLIYKSVKYPLPYYAMASEAVIIVMLALTQSLRYVLAKKAVLDK
jgi:hypothetical protein